MPEQETVDVTVNSEGGVTSAQTTTPITNQGGDPSKESLPEFSKIIPEEFREKAYLKDVDSVDKLFSKLDASQKLIGERPGGIPNENASQEEWDKFYKTFGRPESSDKYEFKKIDLPEGYNSPDEAFEKSIRELFFKAGASQKQASVLQEGFDNLLLDKFKTQNDQFETLSQEVFGSKKDEAMQKAHSMLDEHTPDVLKDKLNSLNNESLVIMAGVLNKIHDKYIREDGLPSGGHGSPATSEKELREEAKKLMLSDAYRQPMHSSHDETRKKINDIYQRIGKFS